ncbi:MAG TPA: thioredoxin family protein [Phycisphaerae bacterium]|nr:thioredoxin family protein [Phycisphaerae bacterium]
MAFDFRSVFQRALPYGSYLQHYANEEQRQRWARSYDAIELSGEQKALLASFRRKMNVLCLTGAWCGDCVNACPIFQRFAEACPLINLVFVNRVQKFVADAPVIAAPVKPGTASDPDDIRSTQIGKILVKWGVLSPERVDKALLAQEERKARGLNARIGDVMTDMGMISIEQRDKALAAQGGFGSFDSWDTAVAKELMLNGGSRVPMLVFLSEDWMECGRYGERTLTSYREKARKKLSSLEGASCPTGLMVEEKNVLAANVADWLEQFERVQWLLLTSPRLSALHGEH